MSQPIHLDADAVRLLAELLEPALAERQPDDALLDANAAANLLGVPASWLLAEARADRIPHIRLGRYVRFDRAELRAWWQTDRARGPRRNGATA